MNRKIFFILFMLLCLAGLTLGGAGCQAGTVVGPDLIGTSTGVKAAASPTPASATEPAGLPNPASVYCEENGGTVKFGQDAEGGVSGVCVFPDGSECDEWAYFRGECKPVQPTPTFSPADYAFPTQIDPARRYLFYLHGKIVEDQGLPAVSADYGEYEYLAILQALSEKGFRVISEQRPRDNDPREYAQRVAEQVSELLAAGVPAENISVVGASKGAGIAIYVSNLIKNEKINYVPMAICAPGTVAELIQAQVALHGNVLSIYDSADEYAGSCADLFAYSEGKGLARHKEIVLNIGTGHGILYQPLDVWVIPVVEWAQGR